MRATERSMRVQISRKVQQRRQQGMRLKELQRVPPASFLSTMLVLLLRLEQPVAGVH
jgi:hypothetical protein